MSYFGELLRDARVAPASIKVAMSVILAFAAVAILAPVIAPFREGEIVGAAIQGWTRNHPLGTDTLGRDVLSRLIYGARNTIGIAVVTTVISFSVGVTLGFVAASAGGVWDMLLSRIVDVVMAVPPLILALLVLTIFKSTTLVLILIMALIDMTRVFRMARALANEVVASEYYEAAKLRGEGPTWIIYQEILPNTLAIVLSEYGIRFCYVLLFISALSFLGVGLQPPIADWGSMVRESAILISFNMVTPLIPAAAIALLTLAVSFCASWMMRRNEGRQP